MSAAQSRKSYRMNIMTLGVALLLAGATTSSLFDGRLDAASSSVPRAKEDK